MVALIYLNFFNRQFFLEQFLAHSKTEWKVEISHILPAHLPPLPHCPHHSLKWYICYNSWTSVDASSPPKGYGLHSGSLLLVYFYRCDVCVGIMTRIHHGSTAQSRSPALSILGGLPVCPPSAQQALAATGLFTVCTVLSSPECPGVEII